MIWAKAVRLLALVWLACLLAQAYLAGLAVMGDGAAWAAHRAFGMLLLALATLMCLAAWAGRLGRRLPLLASIQLLLMVVQAATIVWRDGGGSPFGSALHAANALLIFGLGAAIAARASALTRG